MDNSKRSIFIIGARGYNFKYGGWETFVRGLIDNWKDNNYRFYIFEKVENVKDEGLYEINENVTLIKTYVKDNGGFTMMHYDYKATNYVINLIRKNNIMNPIVYYLGLRIGPYVYLKRRKLKRLNAVIIENAAGLEWKRTKWNVLVQMYLWLSAYFMARASDYLICDSEGILTEYNKMIRSKRPKKLFIPYGTYTTIDKIIPKTESCNIFFEKFNIEENRYYLIINRFVPENSYELILSQFLKSNTQSDLILVTNYKTEIKFYNKLLSKLAFDKDKRIKFVGPIYDSAILDYLRANARGYINGHTLGGTNPGLLEAMSVVDVNIVYDVIFARQVGQDAVLYYDKNEKKLKDIISYCDLITESEKKALGEKAKQRMITNYSWDLVVEKYRIFFDNI